MEREKAKKHRNTRNIEEETKREINKLNTSAYVFTILAF
jgi:hypothetical protein